MNFSKHYCHETQQRQQPIQMQQTTMPSLNGNERSCIIRRRIIIPRISFTREHCHTRCVESLAPRWQQCEHYPNPGCYFGNTVPTPEVYMPGNLYSNITLHVVMKVSKFNAEEITVRADTRMISIECKRDERADDEGGFASYHCVRRVSVPSGVDIRYMESWVMNGVLNIRAPYVPISSYIRGARVTVKLTLPDSSQSYPRNLTGDAQIGAQGNQTRIADLTSAFQNMTTQPGCSTWSIGVNGSVQRPQANIAKLSEIVAPQLGQKGLETSPSTDPEGQVKPSPVQDAEQTLQTPRSSNSLEDLSYEMLSLTKGENEEDSDATSNEPSDA